jgi:hypothetical protein
VINSFVENCAKYSENIIFFLIKFIGEILLTCLKVQESHSHFPICFKIFQWLGTEDLGMEFKLFSNV